MDTHLPGSCAVSVPAGTPSFRPHSLNSLTGGVQPALTSFSRPETLFCFIASQLLCMSPRARCTCQRSCEILQIALYSLALCHPPRPPPQTSIQGEPFRGKKENSAAALILEPQQHSFLAVNGMGGAPLRRRPCRRGERISLYPSEPLAETPVIKDRLTRERQTEVY